MHSATEGKRSQIKKGKESRNHGRKQARVRKVHEQTEQFGVDGEVKEQRQGKQLSVRGKEVNKVCGKRQMYSKVKNERNQHNRSVQSRSSRESSGGGWQHLQLHSTALIAHSL